MNYLGVYIDIIERANSENRKKNQGIYYERHHILPRCMDGDNSKENLVLLTAREHFLCHRILVLEFPEERGLFYALRRMLSSGNLDKSKLSSREYERLSLEYSEFLKVDMLGKRSGNKHPMWGKKHKEISKSRISDSLKGAKNHFFGKKHSVETIEKLSGSNNHMFGKKHSKEYIKMMSNINTGSKNPNYGKTHSKEVRKKISEALLNRKAPSKTPDPKECPHCGFEGVRNMNRYHFDNCKYKNP